MNQSLLIIDAQQELIDGNEQENPIYNKEQLIKTINDVIEQAVKNNIEIIFVRDLDVAEGNGKGFEIHNEIKIPVDSKFFNKSATNSFYGTGLLEHLKNQNINHVVILGCETQHCIDSAVRTATINGIDVTLVSDGHSTIGNNVLEPKQIIDHHNVTLHGHYNVDNFSIVRGSKEDLFNPTHDTYR
ncbi:cysteine hydrolase family protein [Solibacillus sp. FSL K6-1523]|uniref:cysteine hydrolase family protein n=1 Tax=Solibacillus sp. FSL K6-1523 TaxID=2921471 RepID=UPI0030F9427F